MKELDELMAQLAGTLRDLGVPVSGKISPEVGINTRAKRRLGCCYFGPDGMRIEVSSFVLDSPKELRDTLLHELIHTCPGCRDHGERWKTYAGIVNSALGTEIEARKISEEPLKPLRHEEVKYIIKCESCGRIFERRRLCKVVKSPGRYRCPCGGKLIRIK